MEIIFVSLHMDKLDLEKLILCKDNNQIKLYIKKIKNNKFK